MKATGTHEQQRSRRGTRLLFSIIALLAVGLGILAYLQLRKSAVLLTGTLKRLERGGRVLTISGCIDEVIAAHRHCAAMKSLCDQSVERMVATCLAGRDRRAECAALPSGAELVRFGYQACLDRGFSKRGSKRKPCSDCYRTVDAYCSALRTAARR
jgi:predicted nucleic acid-binding Zn ribbon protein